MGRHRPRSLRVTSRRVTALTAAACASVGLLVAVPGTAHAATISVTNTADSGTGSLRDAINQANADPDLDIIDFDFSPPLTPPYMITLTSTSAENPLGAVLPPIVYPVNIDATTIPTWTPGHPQVEIRSGGPFGGAAVFTVDSDAVTISGLSVAGDGSNGFQVGVDVLDGTSGATINDSQFGVDLAGQNTQGPQMNAGIRVRGGVGAEVSDNLIANASAGIALFPTTSSAAIFGNTIGLSRDGSNALPVNTGIDMTGVSDVTVMSNIIDGDSSTNSGISLNGGSVALIEGNFMGVRADGTGLFPGRAAGGLVVSTSESQVTGLNVQNNRFQYGSGNGITLNGATAGITGSVSGNLIAGNSGSGIRASGALVGRLDLGGNQNFDNSVSGIDTGPSGANASPEGPPVITAALAGSATLELTYDGPATSSSQDADLYLSDNDACYEPAQGVSPLYRVGIPLDASGDFMGTVSLPSPLVAGQHLTAMITPTFGVSTEYSDCFPVTDVGIGHEPLTLGATPDPASLGVGQSVDITLQGTDADGDPLTFGLPWAAASAFGNSVQLIGTAHCDNNTPSTCTQVARYSANTAFVGPDEFLWTVNDGALTSPFANVTVNVVDADLDVVQAYPVVATFSTGDQVTFQASVLNHGPDDAADTVVTFTGLPTGTTFVSGSAQDGVNPGSNPCSEAAGVITCPVGHLTPTLATAEVILQTSAATPDSFALTATASSATPDSHPANDQRTSPTVARTAVGDADLAIQPLVDAPDPVTAGGNVQYTTTVTNNGPGDATGATFRLYGDTFAGGLPGATTFTSGAAVTPSGPTTCSLVSGSVECPIGALSNGESADITVYLDTSVLLPNGSTITVTGDVTSTSVDPNGANDTDLVSTGVLAFSPEDTTVFVPPSTQTQTVATASTVNLNGVAVPVAAPGDTTAAAISVPPGGPGGVVTVDEQTCSAPFVCGLPGGASQLIDDKVVAFVPPPEPYYNFQHPLTYTVTYDRSVLGTLNLKAVTVYYVKDDAPSSSVRAKWCGTTLTSSTVFPCLKRRAIIKSRNLAVRGDLRVTLLATYDDPKIGTYKG
jgi:uncharacterized repeat protein (TIGR01451 family)